MSSVDEVVNISLGQLKVSLIDHYLFIGFFRIVKVWFVCCLTVRYFTVHFNVQLLEREMLYDMKCYVTPYIIYHGPTLFYMIFIVFTYILLSNIY